jgi:hypothetical protein
VLADFHPLIAAYPKASAAEAADFPIPAGSGTWRCTVMQGAEGRVLAVRTFVEGK